MKISWALANATQIDPTLSIDKLKELGSFWGGWRTWRSCQTDNVVCHDLAKATELIQRNFHLGYNFYIPNNFYKSLNRPNSVKLYEGDFKHDVDNQEDIVTMHLAAATSDIVLLLGFDFSEQPKLAEKLAEHKANNYRSLTRQAVIDNPQVQWVVVNHPEKFRKDLQQLSNLGKDDLQNILSS